MSQEEQAHGYEARGKAARAAWDMRAAVEGYRAAAVVYARLSDGRESQAMS